MAVDLLPSLGSGSVGGFLIAILDVFGLHKRVNKLEDSKLDCKAFDRFQDKACNEMRAIREDIKDLSKKIDERIDHLNKRIDILVDR